MENHVLAILPPELPIKDLEWDSGDGREEGNLSKKYEMLLMPENHTIWRTE